MSLSGDREAWLALRLVPDIGRVRFHRLIEAFGSPENALGASVEALRRVPGMDSLAAENIARRESLSNLEREKELIEAHGVRLTTLRDEEYPVNLRNSFLPPALLYVRGTLEPDDRFAIAIVGSRMSSPYGRMATDQIAGQLAAAGMAIVSGLAVGIDSAAHRSALRHGGRTLAVMANGLSRCYPAENRHLMEEIVERGAVLSEYPMEEKPARMNFPERNRILAALALGTVVAEAPRRSGALITAELTLEENRALYALPSDITRKTGEGSNDLIRQGAAKLITSGRDILEDLHGQLRGLLGEKDAQQAELARPSPQISDDEAKILDCLAQGPLNLDELMAGTAAEGFGLGRLSTLLLSLEMKKVIRQLPGKIFAVVK